MSFKHKLSIILIILLSLFTLSGIAEDNPPPDVRAKQKKENDKKVDKEAKEVIKDATKKK